MRFDLQTQQGSQDQSRHGTNQPRGQIYPAKRNLAHTPCQKKQNKKQARGGAAGEVFAGGYFHQSLFCHEYRLEKRKIARASAFCPSNLLAKMRGDVFDDLQRLIAMDSILSDIPAFRNGIKTLVGCSLALALAQVSQIYNGYWIVVTVVILTNANPEISWHKSLARICGSILGAISGVAVLAMSIQHPFLLALGIMICMIISGYGASGQEYPYAFMIYGLSAMLVICMGLASIDNVFPVAFFRSLDITLGILIYWLVNMTLWPKPYRRDIPRSLQKCIKSMQSICRGIAEKVCGNNIATESDSPKKLETITRGILDDNLALLGELQKNPFLHDTTIDQYTRFATAIKDALFKLDFLLTLLKNDGNVIAIYEANEGLEQRAASVMRRLDGLSMLLDQCHSHPHIRPAIRPRIEAVDHETYRQLYGKLLDRRIARMTLNNDDLPVIETLRIFESVEESLFSAAVALDGFDPRRAPTGLNPRPLSLMASYIRESLKRPNPFGLRHGIKLGLVILLSFFITYATQWQGALAMMFTAFITMQPNLGSGLKMMVQRTAGSCIGIGYGLLLSILVFPTVTTLGVLLFWCAPLFFIIGWGVTAQPGRTFLYMQLGISFGFAVLAQFAPPETLSRFADWGLGVIAGCLLAGTLNYLVWPVQARGMLVDKLRGMAADSRRIARILFQSLPVNPEDEESITARIRRIRTLAQSTASDARKLLSDAGTELTGASLDEQNALRLIECLRSLPIHITVAGTLWRKCAGLPLAREWLAKEFDIYFAALDRRLHHLENALGQGKLPDPDSSTTNALEVINLKIHELKQERGTLVKDPADFAKFVLLRQTLHSIDELLNHTVGCGSLVCSPSPTHHVLQRALAA